MVYKWHANLRLRAQSFLSFTGLRPVTGMTNLGRVRPILASFFSQAPKHTWGSLGSDELGSLLLPAHLTKAAAGNPIKTLVQLLRVP